MRSYKLYYLDDKKRVYFGDVFEAETDEDAAKKVDEVLADEAFVKEHGKKVFWAHHDMINVVDDEGNVVESYSTADEMTKDWEKKEEKRFFGKKILDWIERKWYRYDPWFNTKCAFERMFKKYDRRVLWNIDNAMVELLQYSIPRYVKNLHGCPNSYAMEARRLLTGKSMEEAQKSYESDPNSTLREINVGMALFKSDLEELLENINVVSYYDNHGIQEPEDENWVSPHKFPIPHLRNSEVIDYKKLDELREKKVDEIFKYLREHLFEMWD
jgi:hypothetical protein